uniref:hypothetical protein n=1 Tax=Lactobacillus taiwanensis TaxID=508451 RepID=UPI0025580BF2
MTATETLKDAKARATGGGGPGLDPDEFVKKEDGEANNLKLNGGEASDLTLKNDTILDVEVISESNKLITRKLTSQDVIKQVISNENEIDTINEKLKTLKPGDGSGPTAPIDDSKYVKYNNDGNVVINNGKIFANQGIYTPKILYDKDTGTKNEDGEILYEQREIDIDNIDDSLEITK